MIIKFRTIHRQFKHYLRNIRLNLGYALLDKKITIRPLPNKSEINKLLFIRHDGKIGDFIVSSFVFREIKKHAPHIKIDVVSHAKTVSLLANNPYIDQIFVPKSHTFIGFAHLGRQLWHQHYDIVIDPTITLRNRDLILIRQIKARFNIGYNQSTLALFNVIITGNELHTSEVYEQILSLLDFQSINNQYDIREWPDSAKAVEQFIKQHNITHYLALNFFGAGRSRQFDEQKILLLINKVLADNPHHQVLLLTMPRFTPLLMKISQKINSSRLFIYHETTTIFDTISLIKHAEGVISPDTAIVHIASGLQKPLIAFYYYHQDNFQSWHPNSHQPYRLFFYKNNVNDLPVANLDFDFKKLDYDNKLSYLNRNNH